ncbi:hypothetical protein JL721_395 [Aureococcus anophagefferens]|nr:hypothetical protein JL721_395 [Aureococcus anophagefferens]
MSYSDDEEDVYEYSEDDEDADDGIVEEPARTRARSESFASGGRGRANSQRLGDGVYSLVEGSEVAGMLDVKAAEAAELLGVPVAQAEALLRHAGWNSERLMEGFWGDGERLSRAAGVEAWGSEAAPVGRGEITCRICFADCAPGETLAAPCGHRFCGDCYGGYACNKVDEGPGCVGMACPEAGCACVVPPDVLDTCLDAPRRAKLARFRVENYVSFTKELRWCPGAGCTKVARAGPCVGAVKCAPNGCGANFCFRCGEEAHAPCDCALVARWVEKCQNESETANWILANTKRCPKCQTRIEKNQGCNHMNCSQCKYEFCWMCMGDWSDHGATTGGYYKCNKYDPAKADADDGDDQARAKRELDRYLHYYKRYHGHDQAMAFATKQLEATERRMVELQESTQGSWIDVQFLKAANEMVIECRRVLKNTYVFGYYLPTDAAKQRELFENLQEHLEKFTETLSEMTELPIDQMDRTEIVNVTRVTESFLANLIQGAEAGLDMSAA